MTHEDLRIAITDGVAVVTLDRPAERNAFSGAMTRSPARIGGAKALQAKPADLAKCQAKSDLKLSKLNGVASAAALPCRYGDNGDGTVTDSDTGLQWERKTDDFTYHDKDNTFTWSPSNNEPDGTVFTILLGLLNRGTSGDGSTTSGCFAGHCDWRLPAIGELAGIVDLGASGCGSVSPCIDETVFGPTTASLYWSATTDDLPSAAAWVVDFDDGASGSGLKAARPTRGRFARISDRRTSVRAGLVAAMALANRQATACQPSDHNADHRGANAVHPPRVRDPRTVRSLACAERARRVRRAWRGRPWDAA